MPFHPTLQTLSLTAGAWHCSGKPADEPKPELKWLLILPRKRFAIRQSGRRALLLPGMALVVEPGECLAMTSVEGAPIEATLFSVTDPTVAPALRPGIRPLSAASLIAHHCWQSLETQPIDGLSCEQIAFDLIASICSMDAPAPVFPGRLRRKMEDALEQLIQASEPRSLVALAESVGLTPCSLSRAISESLGMPFREYSLRLKLAKALDLMRTGPELSIGAIAFLAGFSSHAHFTDVMRARVGFSPRHVRPLLTARRHQELIHERQGNGPTQRCVFS